MSVPDEIQELPLEAPPRRSVGTRKVKPKAHAPEPDQPHAPMLVPTVETKSASGAHPIGRWFVRCLLVGAGLSVLGVFENPVLHWVGVLGPVAATAAYPLIGAALDFHRSPSQRERFADNCYYLGFIFTQIALLVGFSPVLLFNREIGSQDVLRAFSMALGAALVGLVARTYFIQTGHSLSENSQRIEDEVEALATSVSRQASTVLSQFDLLGARLSEAYRDLNDELVECVGSLVGTLKRYDAALGRDLRTVEAGTSSITVAAAESVASVQAEQSRFVEGIQHAVRSIEAVRTSASEQLQTTTALINSSTQALSRSADALTSASGLGERLANVEARVSSAAETASQVQAELEKTVQQIASTGSSAAVAVEAAGRELTASTVARAEAFERQLTEAVQSLERTLAGFRSELERVRV